MNNVKTVTLRLSEELHKALKIKMAKEEKKIQDYVVDLIKKDMEFKDENKK